MTGGSNGIGELGPLVALRFAPDGTLVWQRTWADVASGSGIAVAPDGHVYIAGVAPRPGADFDMVLLKLDPQGTLVWQGAYSTAEVADAAVASPSPPTARSTSPAASRRYATGPRSTTPSSPGSVRTGA